MTTITKPQLIYSAALATLLFNQVGHPAFAFEHDGQHHFEAASVTGSTATFGGIYTLPMAVPTNDTLKVIALQVKSRSQPWEIPGQEDITLYVVRGSAPSRLK